MTLPPELAEAFGLANRVAVITGAASGIGRQTAVTFAQAGARVVLADLDPTGLAETADRVVAAGGRADAFQVDVADRAQVEALREHAIDVAGQIDVWANVAGILLASLITETTEDDLDRQLGVNLKGVYWGCAAAARAMVPRGRGSIINVSSAGADLAVPGLAAYAMTKSAVMMITRTLAHEVGPHGVRANAVAPGYVDTPMVAHRFRRPDGTIDAARRAEVFADRAAQSVLGRVGTTTDISLAMLYLAADASGFVTGQILRPNGGVAMP